MTIRIGIVGLSKSNGWAASGLAPPLYSEPLNAEYTLSALSTSSAASAHESAAHYSKVVGSEVRAYHGSTDAIAADDALDLVAVAVKAPAHREAVLPLLEKGQNVFVEWPLGKNLAETKELTAKAKEKGVRTMVGLQGWQTPFVKRIREIIAEGRIGAVMNVTWVAVKEPHRVPYWPPFVASPFEYILDPSQGATLADIWLGHNFSVITRALGPLVSLSATGVIAIPTVKVGTSVSDPALKEVPATLPDQYSVSGVFAESGALFTGSWRSLALGAKSTEPTLLWFIDGSKGQLRVQIDPDSSEGLGGAFPHISPPVALFVNGETISLEEENAELGGNVGRAWAAYARGAEGEYPTFEDAHVLKQHIEAVKKSAEVGTRISVGDL
ncbi:NAD-binding Rossmann fold oxidoreductase [Peniophora sp. CONT]|nr:NAD-binding Rossmann fold oxidoreductase [Peniophora sp. CONT]